MARRSFGEDVAAEMSVHAAVLGPAIEGTVVLGPVGILLGAGSFGRDSDLRRRSGSIATAAAEQLRGREIELWAK